MNILILNWRDTKNPKAGGAEIVTLEHAKAWVKAGHSVTWFTSTFQNSKKEEVIDGVKIIRKGSQYANYLHAPFYYFRNRRNIDIIIDEIHGIPYFTPLYVKKPTIAFIHEIAGEIWDYMYPFPVNIAGKLVEKLFLRLYKNIQFWTDAPSTVEELKSYGIKNSIAIPCPITNKVINKLPEKEKVPTFIFVSRIVKMKGIEDVIDAFKFIHEKDKSVKLWIVGDGEEKYVKSLKQKVKSLKLDENVTFFGRVSEEKKLELMGRAHLLLHASVKEGWGLVVLEAASQGTPSVVYNVPGLRDIVKQKETGNIVNKNSPEELAATAMRLLQDKKTYLKYQENCLILIRSLQWEKVTEDSFNLLKKSVSASKR